jgi:hypothetical protein
MLMPTDAAAKLKEEGGARLETGQLRCDPAAEDAAAGKQSSITRIRHRFQVSQRWYYSHCCHGDVDPTDHLTKGPGSAPI